MTLGQILLGAVYNRAPSRNPKLGMLMLQRTFMGKYHGL